MKPYRALEDVYFRTDLFRADRPNARKVPRGAVFLATGIVFKHGPAAWVLSCFGGEMLWMHSGWLCGAVVEL